MADLTMTHAHQWSTDEFAEAVDGLGSAAVRAAATLRLADHVAGGYTTPSGLAVRTGVAEDLLTRLMDYLTCRGVFGASPQDGYTLTPLSVMLLDGHPAGLRRWLDVDGIGARMDAAIAALTSAMRFGAPAYPRIHGSEFYADMAGADGHGPTFDELRGRHAGSFADEVAALDCWADARMVVDVGGGIGVVAERMLSRHPGMRVHLVDLPDAVAIARRRVAGAEVADRLVPTPGDFFAGLPADADAYLIVNVLHNWDDEHALRILRRCAEAATPASRIFIIERVQEKNEPWVATAMDLRMFLFCGGQERTTEHYWRLASVAGMALDRVTEMPSGMQLIQLRMSGAAPHPHTVQE